MTRRPAALVLALLVSAATLGVVTPQRAEASCAGPVIGVGGVIDESGAAPEAAVPLPRDTVVSGRWFFTGCDDNGTGPAPGCTAEREDEQSPTPDVELVLTRGTESWSLGSADAGPAETEYAVTWDVQLPPDVEPGPATLTADGAVLAVDVLAAR